MAMVRKLEQLTLDRNVRHLDVKCTYSLIQDENGDNYLQIDTYGSSQRQIHDKKSQSLRFSPEALNQLRDILQKDF